MFLAVQSDRNDQKHPSCRDTVKVKGEKSVISTTKSKKGYVRNRKKKERYFYVNKPLLGQKSQVSFLCLGEKRIFRQAERVCKSFYLGWRVKRAFVNMNIHNLGHDG